MKAVGITDVGRNRKKNEDYIFVPSKDDDIANLFIVADGMGGHSAGDVASRTAVNSFVEYIRNERLVRYEDEIPELLAEASWSANWSVYEQSILHKSYANMGTTIVAASVLYHTLYIVYAGDSRGYLFRNHDLIQITTDHSYVAELIKKGEITPEEALTHPNKNLITKAVGIYSFLEIETIATPIQKNDVLLLCTDGLSNMVSDEEIIHILNLPDSFEYKVKTLVDLANQHGGQDNISVILVDIGGNEA